MEQEVRCAVAALIGYLEGSGIIHDLPMNDVKKGIVDRINVLARLTKNEEIKVGLEA